MCSPAGSIDCVIIGYNEIDFNAFAARQKAMEDHSGAYHEVKTNSVLLDGQRRLYMDLLNRALTRATGQNPRLSIFNVPALGVCYLKSYLQKRHFQVEIVNFFTQEKDTLEALLALNPRAVAITTTFYIENEPIIEIVKFVRERSPETAIIVGGPHIFNLVSDFEAGILEYVFQQIGADIYIYDSQGEQSLSQVLRRLQNGRDLSDVPNLIYKASDGTFQQTRRVVEVNDLDENSVEWSYFDPNFITPSVYLRTATGCPFACAFCPFPGLGGRYTLADLNNIERQLHYLRQTGVQDVVFVDDCLNVPKARFKNLLRMLIRNRFDFRWASFFRCSHADEETFDLMQESGCLGVFLGIESGDQTILNVMNKKAEVDKYRWAMAQLHQHHIVTYASLICGFPGETEVSVRNTIAFIEETAPTYFNIQLYYHDTRAPIQQRAAEFGLQGAGYSWQTKRMDWKDAAGQAKYMYQSIKNSIPITLLGYSLWGISYLVSKGFSLDQIRAFGILTRPMLLQSLDDQPSDHVRRENQLADLFRLQEAHTANREIKVSDEFARQIQQQYQDELYWTQILTDGPKRVNLPYDFPPEEGHSFQRNEVEMVWNSTLVEAMQTLAAQNTTSMSHVVLTIFTLFLFQLSQQQQFCVGLLMPASRGFVPVRMRLSADMEFDELLEHITRTTTEAVAHLSYSIEQTAISNVVYGFLNTAKQRMSIQPTADISLWVVEQDSQLRLTLEYNRHLLLTETVQRYLATLKRFACMVTGTSP